MTLLTAFHFFHPSFSVDVVVACCAGVIFWRHFYFDMTLRALEVAMGTFGVVTFLAEFLFMLRCFDFDFAFPSNFGVAIGAGL